MRTFSFPKVWITLSILNKNNFFHRKDFNIYFTHDLFLDCKIDGCFEFLDNNLYDFVSKIRTLVQSRKFYVFSVLRVQILYLNGINIFRDKIQVLYLPLLFLLLSAFICTGKDKFSVHAGQVCESDNSSIETIRLLLDL